MTPSGATTVIYIFGPYNTSTYDNSGGFGPVASLVLGHDGSLYGTAPNGGTNGDGTIFAVSTSGSFSTIVNFTGAGGSYPGWVISDN